MTYKPTAILAATMLATTTASAMPALPSAVIQKFVKSKALHELLIDNESYSRLTITLVPNPSDAVEALCNQKSRSRSIVAVTLGRDSGVNEFFFQTPSDPSDLKRCLPGDDEL